MQLTKVHIRYARRLAGRYISKKHFPDRAIDDIYSAALFGLATAFRNFDSGRGVKFETFAYPAIVGAMKRAAFYDSRHPIVVGEPDETSVGSDDDIESAVLFRQVAPLINALPERQRTVVLLYCLEENTPLDIERRTGGMIGNRQVQWLHRQAMKTLRAELGIERVAA